MAIQLGGTSWSPERMTEEDEDSYSKPRKDEPFGVGVLRVKGGVIYQNFVYWCGTEKKKKTGSLPSAQILR